jgi:1-acyl-sn-glycerol-3-phosphate acyltransferase
MPYPCRRKILSEIPGLGSAADPRDKKTYYFQMNPFRRVVTAVLYALFNLVGRLEVKGVENLPDSGAVVLAANHMTNFDVFPLQFALPRPIFYMGKEELFRNPLLDWILRRLGGFPVYRGAKDAWAIRHSEKVLEHGQVLGIFPEGTRNKGAGLRPAKTGAARLAQTAACPIVPVAIHGTQYLLKGFPRRTKVTITIGAPLYVDENETTLSLTDRMMFALADLLPPEARGAYRYRPPGF